MLENPHARMVLVVDDDPMVLRSTTRVLSARYGVQSCLSPYDALVRVHGGGIGVVVTDFEMPGMSGLELTRRIREHDSRLPVVLMTAHESVRGSRALVNAGIFACIAKPFEASTLLTYVDLAFSPDLVSAGRQRGGSHSSSAS